MKMACASLAVMALWTSVLLAQEWQRGLEQYSVGCYDIRSKQFSGPDRTGKEAGLLWSISTGKNRWPLLYKAIAYSEVNRYQGLPKITDDRPFDKVTQYAAGCFWPLGHITPGAGQAITGYKTVSADWAGIAYEYAYGQGEKTHTLTFHVSRLSPSVWLECSGDRLQLFSSLSQWGLGPPTRVAYAGKAGVVVRKAGDRAAGELFSGAEMAESWILCWFSGAGGWTNGDFDCPMLVVLEKKPAAVSMSAEGLALEFGGSAAGQVAVLSLFGVAKSDVPEKRFTQARSLGWDSGIPADVLERVRQWTSYAKAIPVACREYYLADRTADAWGLKEEFDYRIIRDEWGTQPRFYAPLPPWLALALKHAPQDGIELTVSGQVADFGMLGNNGPVCGIDGAREFEVRGRGLLKYVYELDEPSATAQMAETGNGSKRATLPVTTPVADPTAAWAIGEMSRIVALRLEDPLTGKVADPSAASRKVLSNDGSEGAFLADCMPYVSSLQKRQIQWKLLQYLTASLLDPAKYGEHRLADSQRPLLYRDAETPGGTREMEVLNCTVLWALDEYVRHTGDVDVAKEAWELVERLPQVLAYRHDWAMGIGSYDEWTSTVQLTNVEITASTSMALLARRLHKDDLERLYAAHAIKLLLARYSQWKFVDFVRENHGIPEEFTRNRRPFYIGNVAENLSWVDSDEGGPWLGLPSYHFYFMNGQTLRFFQDHMRDEIGAWVKELDNDEFICPHTRDTPFGYVYNLNVGLFVARARILGLPPKELARYFAPMQGMKGSGEYLWALQSLIEGGRGQWRAVP